jgi:hypothetical protein
LTFDMHVLLFNFNVNLFKLALDLTNLYLQDGCVFFNIYKFVSKCDADVMLFSKQYQLGICIEPNLFLDSLLGCLF